MSAGNLYRLDPEQLARNEPFPFRRKELIVTRIDERRRDLGMFGERIAADGRCSRPQTFVEKLVERTDVEEE